MTHLLPIEHENLITLKECSLFLTNDKKYKTGDTIIIQERDAGAEQAFSIIEYECEEIPALKKGYFLFILTGKESTLDE